jgi:hypothetical protein
MRLPFGRLLDIEPELRLVLQNVDFGCENDCYIAFADDHAAFLAPLILNHIDKEALVARSQIVVRLVGQKHHPL